MEIRIISALLAACSFMAQAQSSGTVILVVEGIDTSRGGQLSAGIFVEKNFPKVGGQLLGIQKQVSSNVMQLVLQDVPPGSYGVAVFHDLDSNNALETNFVGLPKEPIGFSNDARIRFGSPSWDEARFTVQPGREVKLKIILR
jgi:uncharacterized protein (DUF2141 family)